MSDLVLNPHAYAFGPATQKVKITFEIALDMVPGWGHDIEDHINLMFRCNPYIVGIEGGGLSQVAEYRVQRAG